MKSTIGAVILTSIAVSLAAACGGGAAPTTSSRPSTASAPSTAPRATTAPSVGGVSGDLCTAFTQELAVAALGQPVAAPQSGDVLPRPNGIYCHYNAAADASLNVEAQLKEMSRAEFEELSTKLSVTDAQPGVGEAAYQLDRSFMGGSGATVMVWRGGRGVTVGINANGSAAQMKAAAIAIAKATLA